jgi:hypothetical protein
VCSIRSSKKIDNSRLIKNELKEWRLVFRHNILANVDFIYFFILSFSFAEFLYLLLVNNVVRIGILYRIGERDSWIRSRIVILYFLYKKIIMKNHL